MSFVDLGILLLLGYYSVRGFSEGLWEESLAFSGLILAALAALYGFEKGGDYLAREYQFSRPIVYITATVGIFLSVLLLFRIIRFFLAWVWLNRSPSWPSRVGGGLLAFFKGSFMVSILLLTASLFPFSEGIHARVEAPGLPRTFRQIAPTTYRYCMRYLPPATKDRYFALLEKVSPLKVDQAHHPKGETRPVAPKIKKAPAKKGEETR